MWIISSPIKVPSSVYMVTIAENLSRDSVISLCFLQMLKEDFVEIHADIDALNASSELQVRFSVF